jgi:hypothetical protein
MNHNFHQLVGYPPTHSGEQREGQHKHRQYGRDTEADLLYNLVVRANVEVLENRAQREREYIPLLGYLGAEMRGSPTKSGSRTCAWRF